MRLIFLPLLALPPLGAAALAQQQPAASLLPDPTASESPAALLPFGTIDSRLTVPVSVGGSGPYPFIVDTGAQRTVVSRELASSLRLAAGRTVNLTSMTERRTVATVRVPELAIDTIGRRHAIEAPALDARNLGAAGLLGIDTLGGHQVTIDFEAGHMAVRKSVRRQRGQPRADDEIVVTARSKLGQLIVTDATFGGARIRVVIDTGSVVSVGNGALRRLAGRRAGKPQPIELTSVTGGKTTADYSALPGVKIGPVRFESLPVAFADVAPFGHFDLDRRPALLLGMDALASFRRVEIDFANREVRFLMPKDSVVRGRAWAPD